MTTERVQLGLSGKVRSVSDFGSVKQAEPKTFSPASDLSNPFSVLFVPAHSKDSAFTVFVRAFSVVHIFRSSRFPKIGYGVVRSDAINMVNLSSREYTMNIQPCQSMSKVSPAVYDNPCVSIATSVSRNASGPFTTQRYAASKNTCIWTIVQNFAQSFGGNVCRIFGSHDVTLSQIGKRRGRIDSAFLASSLYHLKNALLRLEAIEVTGK